MYSLKKLFNREPKQTIWSLFRQMETLIDQKSRPEHKRGMSPILDEMRGELGGDVETPRLAQKLMKAAEKSEVHSHLKPIVEEFLAQFKAEEEEKARPITSFVLLILISVAIGFVIAFGCIFFFSRLTGGDWIGGTSAERASQTLELSGKFADSFGVVTGIFSAAAFAGVLYTINVQRKELSLQREEVRLARREAAKSADALERQVQLSHQSALITGLSYTVQQLDSIVVRSHGVQESYWEGRREYFSQLMEQYIFFSS